MNLQLFEEPGLTPGRVREELAAAGAEVSEASVRAWTKHEMLLAFDWARRELILSQDPGKWDEVKRRDKPSFVAEAESMLRVLVGVRSMIAAREIAVEMSGGLATSPAPAPPWPGDGPLDKFRPSVATRVSRALEVIAEYGGNDNAGHQQWVLDQVARHLTGCHYEPVTLEAGNGRRWSSERLGESEAYRAWRPEAWQEGSAP